MNKYETEFKLKIVERFLPGEGGEKLLALVSARGESSNLASATTGCTEIAGLQSNRDACTADFKLQVLSHGVEISIRAPSTPLAATAPARAHT